MKKESQKAGWLPLDRKEIVEIHKVRSITDRTGSAQHKKLGNVNSQKARLTNDVRYQE